MTDIAVVPVPAVYPPGAPPEDAPAGGSFGRRVAAVAGYLDTLRGVTGARGKLAILRRIRAEPCELPPEAFWEIVARFGIPEAEEPVWLRLLPLMAVHRYDPARSPGAALDDAGVTPARLERWLRATEADAWAQAPRLLARLGATGIDWVALAILLRKWEKEPEQRTRVARDFFRNRYRRTSTQQGA